MTAPASSPVPAVQFDAISKRFGAVHANRAVSFSIAPGEIHGIIGENGAGKSTLMSILYGYYQADSGRITVHGQPVSLRSSQEAIRLGIGMVHQHFMLVENMSVLDNVLLGQEGGFLLGKKRQAALERLRALSAQYQLDVDPLATIQSLSVGVQQRVEILKQLYRSADILILDEPTAVLTVQETAALFDVLRVFRAQGKTILLITHKLQEILDVTDAVTVMRAGCVVGTVRTAETSKEQLAEMMVGRPLRTHLPRAAYAPGAVALEVSHVSLSDRNGVALLKDISFQVHAGEIVAIAGVSGNGQSELLEILAGMRLPGTGSVRLCGQPLPYAGRRNADGLPAYFRAQGLAHVPEDRLRDAVVKSFSVQQNSILGYEARFSGRLGWLRRHDIAQHCQTLMDAFDVRPPDPHLRIALLSGGNQQKVVMAREMAQQPKVLLVGQPTRGVDIGTIESLHTRLLALRDAGAAIVLVSVELEEVRALADRILVMSGGAITGALHADAFDATRIGLLMGGLHTH